MAASSKGNDDPIAAIERGEVDPVYCLHGAERYFLDRCLKAIRTAILGPNSSDKPSFNYDLYDLKESGLDAALSSARTMPMFAKKRLVVGRGIDQVKADQLEALTAYVADPNPSTCLVLYPDRADKVDGRMKAFMAIKKAGFLHEFPRLREQELARWIEQEAHRRKVPFEQGASQALAEAAGSDLGRISQAIDQLALFAGAEKGARVKREDVETLIPQGREREVFELTRAIAEGDRDRSLRLVGLMLRNREPALLIQGALLRQIRQIWRAKELDAQGVPRNELAVQVGIPPFFVEQVLAPARRMSTTALRRGFERLYQADIALKSSRIDDELLITRLVRKLSEDANRNRNPERVPNLPRRTPAG